MIHELKTWPQFFQDVKQGIKAFEIRKNDRNFKVDDILILREYNLETDTYSGDQIYCQVTYLLEGGQFGINHGYCIMQIEHTDGQDYDS
jgi:hypothetical protein